MSLNEKTFLWVTHEFWSEMILTLCKAYEMLAGYKTPDAIIISEWCRLAKPCGHQRAATRIIRQRLECRARILIAKVPFYRWIGKVFSQTGGAFASHAKRPLIAGVWKKAQTMKIQAWLLGLAGGFNSTGPSGATTRSIRYHCLTRTAKFFYYL